MTPDVFTALLSPAGGSALADACAAYRPGAELALVSGLRRRYAAELASSAVTQAALRHRAWAKFGIDAARMYFTPDGLEQATRTTVAEHRAARVAATMAGATVLDLGCGIGGDLIAMARAGLRVTGVDRDPVTVAVAGQNLAALGLDGVVEQGEATETDVAGHDVVFADPARRRDGRRVFDIDAYSPPWAFVTGLLRRTACIKVAPGIPHRAVPDGVEAEWVSDGGEVKEAALWSGPLTTTGRRASVLPAGATLTERDAVEPVAGPALRYLYEPDGAVIRAGLVTAICALTNGTLLDPRIAYVTSDTLLQTPLASAYEITATLPYKDKVLRAWVRDNAVGTLEIKKRGVDLDPAQLRKRLSPTGTNRATLIVTRIGRSPVAYACVRRSEPAAATQP